MKKHKLPELKFGERLTAYEALAQLDALDKFLQNIQPQKPAIVDAIDVTQNRYCRLPNSGLGHGGSTTKRS